jgi:hypothetical protein
MATTTKFELLENWGSKEEMLKQHEDCYKQDGWVLNEYEPEQFEMLLFLPRKIELNVGDLIAIGQFMLVDCKCYDVLKNEIQYVVSLE